MCNTAENGRYLTIPNDALAACVCWEPLVSHLGSTAGLWTWAKAKTGTSELLQSPSRERTQSSSTRRRVSG